MKTKKRYKISGPNLIATGIDAESVAQIAARECKCNPRETEHIVREVTDWDKKETGKMPTLTITVKETKWTIIRFVVDVWKKQSTKTTKR